LHVSLGSPPLKSVKLRHSVHSHLKIVQTQTATVIIIQTNQTTYPSKVGYFNLKQNPTVQAHFKKSSPMHSLLPLSRSSRNATKTTHDVPKLFTRHGEQPDCFKSAWLHWLFLFFVYLFKLGCC